MKQTPFVICYIDTDGALTFITDASLTTTIDHTADSHGAEGKLTFNGLDWATTTEPKDATRFVADAFALLSDEVDELSSEFSNIENGAIHHDAAASMVLLREDKIDDALLDLHCIETNDHEARTEYLHHAGGA